MARRKQQGVSFAPLVIAVVLLVAAYAAWQTAPRWMPRVFPPKPGSATPKPAGSAALDVCALAPAEAARAALGGAATVRHVGAAADVPAAGACTWSVGGKSLVAMLFTPDSLAGGAAKVDAHGYFESVVTGFEYALKSMPESIALGDEAALAGFDVGQGQVVVRHRERVLHVLANGVPRADAERFARAVAASL